MPISVASPARLGTALRAVVRLALESQGRRAGEIGIRLTDDRTLRDLNRRYRSLDRATDVLSFGYEAPVHEASTGRSVDGDIVVSLERVHVQARRFRVSPGRELARVVVHGALHLSGLEHSTAGGRAHMRRHENLVLRACAAQVRALERALERGPLPT